MFAPGPMITGEASPAETGLVAVKQEPEREEEPLILPALEALAPAVIDLPQVDRDGKKVDVKDVLLEAMTTSAASHLVTRIDVRDLSLSVLLGKPQAFSFLHRHPVRPVERKILEGISFSLLPGETTVLLGGPRSGKSSLLDVVAGRRVDGVTGEVVLNGVPPGVAYQRSVSYVVQGDDHAALLTVKETLEFAAYCQMPTTDPRLIDQRVDAVLQLLGLKHVSNTIVGDWAHRGVSGGEKRRCTIGIEWVKGPKFFLLDEPTTGLDSGAAMNVGRCLRAISSLGTPVLCALLQPSWELVSMFDKVLIIAEGQVAFWGTVAAVLPYFASLGFQCPRNYSAAEFIAELVDHPEKFEQDLEGAPMKVSRSSDFLKAWRESELSKTMLSNPPRKIATPALDDSIKHAQEHPTTLEESHGQGRSRARSIYTLERGETASEVFARNRFDQFKLLMWRGWVLAQRNKIALLQQLLATSLIGLVMGLLFFQLGDNLADSGAMFGLIFFLISRLAFNSLAIIPGQFIERPYFIRQRAACYYQMVPYALSSLMLDAPITIVQVWVFSTLVYWLSGMVRAAGHYFFLLLVVCTQGMTFASFSRLWSSISPDPLRASLFASTLCVIFMIYSGFLIVRQRIPKYYIWLHYLSPLKYASDSLVINEFLGRELHCRSAELYPPTNHPNLTLPYPDGFDNVQVCPITTGAALLDSRSLTPKTSTMWIEYMAIVLFFLVFSLAYYVGLRVFKWQPQNRNAGAVSKPPSKLNEKSKSVLNVKQQSNESSHAATLSWSSLKYTVPNPATGEPQALLTDVNGFVSPGMLLALMGPSGAGKTTLLDVLAARKNVGVVTGNIRLDGKPVGLSYPRVIGYVEQFDMHFALQSVEEAFHFAAKSRLPAGIPDHDRNKIVDGVIALLEMEALRPMLVAVLNPEEQKRLAMGVELVSQPSVLFLDEPTSGLDSNGADRVMGAIEKVAKSGTSIVCTIHQPSSRIFFRATHLLLLRRGGRVVYFGELGAQCNTLMSYFSRFGVSAPVGMNPADFVLEIALGNFKSFTTKPRIPSTPFLGRVLAAAEAHDSKDKDRKEEKGGEDEEKKGKKEKKHKKDKKHKEREVPMEAISSASEPTLAPAIAVDEEGLKDLAGSWDKSNENGRVKERLAQIETGNETKRPDDPVYSASLKREYAIKWLPQFIMLMGRWRRALIRMPSNIVVAVARAFLIGFLLGTTFWRRPHDQQGARELTSVLFMSAIYSFLTAFAYIPAFFMQRAIFYRERAERMYRVSSWGISRAIMDLPSIMAGNMIIIFLVYWLAGLRADAGAFFYFFIVVTVFGCVALVFAQMLTAVFASIDVAGLVFSSIFASFALAAGFLIPRPRIRVWMRWLYWLSFNRYFLEALSVNELKGDTFDCRDLGPNGDGFPVPIYVNNSLVFKTYCPITHGNQLLETVGAYEDLQYWDLLCLSGFWILMMLIFLFSLRFFKHQKR